MNAFEARLMGECRLLAENTMWNGPHPRSVEDIVDSTEREAVASAYFDIAVEALNYLRADNNDPEILIRAIQYMSVHAIPPIRDSTAWLREGLHVLLVLACPFAGTPPGGEPCFADIRRGMSKAENWRKE